MARKTVCLRWGARQRYHPSPIECWLLMWMCMDDDSQFFVAYQSTVCVVYQNAFMTLQCNEYSLSSTNGVFSALFFFLLFYAMIVITQCDGTRAIPELSDQCSGVYWSVGAHTQHTHHHHHPSTLPYIFSNSSGFELLSVRPAPQCYTPHLADCVADIHIVK